MNNIIRMHQEMSSAFSTKYAQFECIKHSYFVLILVYYIQCLVSNVLVFSKWRHWSSQTAQIKSWFIYMRSDTWKVHAVYVQVEKGSGLEMFALIFSIFGVTGEVIRIRSIKYELDRLHVHPYEIRRIYLPT